MPSSVIAMPPRVSRGSREGRYAVLELALPGEPAQPLGVVLADPQDDSLVVRLRRDLDHVAPEDELDYLESLAADLERSPGGAAEFEHLQETLSNFLRVSDERAVTIESSARETAERLY